MALRSVWGPVRLKVVKRISGMLDGITGGAGGLVPWADPKRRRAAVERFRQLCGNGNLTAARTRLAASRLGVTERTVSRLSQAAGQPSVATGRAPCQLSEAVREAFARYRGNVACVHRAPPGCAGQPGRAEFVRWRLQ